MIIDHFKAVYEDKHILMKDNRYYTCVFNRCVMEINKGEYSLLDDCVLTDCKEAGDGWPLRFIVKEH